MPSDRIRRILQQFVADVGQAVDIDTQEQVKAELKRLVDGVGSSSSASPTKRPKATPSPPKKKRSYPPHCKFPGCTEPHKGPGHSFLCQKHYEEREAAKKQDGGE